MTRGGVRKGAGRPKKKGEKITVPLPVRVTPAELANIKKAALAIDTPVSQWVRETLALGCVEIFRLADGVEASRRALERFRKARGE